MMSSRSPSPALVHARSGHGLICWKITFAIFFVLMSLDTSTTSASASQCASPSEIAASRTRWAALRDQFGNATDHEMACRVFAASFYESVLARQAAVSCANDADRDPNVSALNSEINTFNDLLAARCGS